MPESDTPFIDLNTLFVRNKDTTGVVDYTTAYSNFNNQRTNARSVIDQQAKLKDIVTKENQRLQDKKDSVDKAVSGQQRAVALNESNRLRQNSYTNLLIILIITLVLFILIMVASNYLTFIPEIVFDILSIIVISIGIYIALNRYLDIQSRNNMNFNELNLVGLPNKLAPKSPPPGSTNSGDLLATLDECVGSSCCSPGTKWDQGNGVCKENFTTLTFSYDTSRTSANAASNSAYEFDKYLPTTGIN